MTTTTTDAGPRLSVVTGASGLIGASLVRALLARGRRVRVLVHRDRRALEGLDVEIVEGDILDRTSLVHAFAGADVVHHLAAQVDQAGAAVRRSRAINVCGTKNVVSACLGAGVGRLVHASSCQALAHGRAPQWVDDSSPLADTRRASEYDRTKAASERAVQAGVELGLDAVILRPSAVVGPYDYKPSQLGAFLLLVARGRLPMLVSGRHDFVDVRDVAEAFVAAETRGRAGEGYLLTGHRATILEVGRLVEKATGRRAPRWAAPRAAAAAFAPAAERVAMALGRRPLFSPEAIRILGDRARLSHRKAERELGFSPRPLERTIADTIEWFRSHGDLP